MTSRAARVAAVRPSARAVSQGQSERLRPSMPWTVRMLKRHVKTALEISEGGRSSLCAQSTSGVQARGPSGNKKDQKGSANRAASRPDQMEEGKIVGTSPDQ